MVDANFRARCKDRSFKDRELGPGWAYFVEESSYMAHVRKHRNKKEVSLLRGIRYGLSCSRYRSVSGEYVLR